MSPGVTRKHSPSSIRNKRLSPPSNRKVGQGKNCDYKVDTAIAPDATPIKEVTEEKLLKGGNLRSRLETRRALFQGNEERATKLAGAKAGSRVVPYECGGTMEEISEVEGGSERSQSGLKDEGLSEIRTQLLQIEKQQTGLLDLLQVSLLFYVGHYILQFYSTRTINFHVKGKKIASASCSSRFSKFLRFAQLIFMSSKNVQLLLKNGEWLVSTLDLWAFENTAELYAWQYGIPCEGYKSCSHENCLPKLISKKMLIALAILYKCHELQAS